MIGRGHEDNGLYILDTLPHSTLPVQQISVPVINDDKLDFLQLSQWHNHLGHPFLFTLKKLFPHLFSSCNSSFL